MIRRCAFCLIVLVPYVSFADDKLLKNQEPVFLELKSNEDGSKHPTCELNLGQVSAGATVKTTVRIKNTTPRNVEFQRVRPTCACVNVSMPVSELGPGESSQIGTIEVLAPRTRGGDIPIADIDLISRDGGTKTATIRVIAKVERAFVVKSPPGSFVLQDGEAFEGAIQIDLDPLLELSQVKIDCDVAALKCELFPKKDGELFGTLKLSGNREELLNAKLATIRLTYPKQDINDAVTVRFLDGRLFRAIPSRPSLENGEFTFHLYRSLGINTEKLEVRSFPSGEKLESNFTARSRQVAHVRIKGTEHPIESIEFLVDGQVVFEVPVCLTKKD